MSLEEQYAIDANLNARIALHARFATNPVGWGRWLFEHELGTVPPGARILEVGCGPATTLWGSNFERIEPSWQLTLADFSAGMIEVARSVLGARAEYVVADVQELPFSGESFDVVLANHMLYHVPDPRKALAEIRRVLVHDGVFHAATNGEGHLREMHDLTADWWPYRAHVEAFGLESGPPELEPFFDDVKVERYADDLAVTDPEPVLAYFRSAEHYDGRDLSGARAAIETAIARDGVFLIHKSQGLITCRKP